jgi:phage gp36-like protein
MAFIVKSDLVRYIDETTIDQLTDDDDTLVTEAIKDAEERISERIGQRVNTATEFAKSGANRQRSLLKHCISLAIYYLFERLYTDVLPEGRIQAMQYAEAWLEDVSKGKIVVNLTKVDEANQSGWPIRWGSQPKKDSQNY